MTSLQFSSQLSLTKYTLILLLALIHPQYPITCILSKPVNSMRVPEHSTSVRSSKNKLHLSLSSTSPLNDYSSTDSERPQGTYTFRPKRETNAPIKIQFIDNFPPTLLNSSEYYNIGLLIRRIEVRVLQISEAESSTRGRGDKPRPFALASTRLLRVIPTIVLWFGFTVVVVALLVAGILSVVYGGLSLGP